MTLDEQSQEDMETVTAMYPIQAQAAALDSARLEELARLAAVDLQVALAIKPKPTIAHEAHIEAIEQFPWVCVPEYDRGDECNWIPLPFSSSIAYAWKLVELAKEDGLEVGIVLGGSIWDVCFFEPIAQDILEYANGMADTAPEAIAKAFLALKKEIRE